MEALKADFKGYEIIQTMLLNKVPKYGNDVAWVDELGSKWTKYFRDKMKHYTNYRGGLLSYGNVYRISSCSYGRKRRSFT